MLAFAVLIALIFALNLVPAFAPPTWMALAFFGFQFPDINPWALALTGALAATCGRLGLALMSHRLFRIKLLSAAQRANIDVLKERLEHRPAITVGVFLCDAISPLPSNFLFIAYGLTGLPLRRVALPFFIGRSLSYTFFIFSGQSAGRHFQVNSLDQTLYVSGYFVVSQIVIIIALYGLTRLDWKSLLDGHKLKWLN